MAGSMMFLLRECSTGSALTWGHVSERTFRCATDHTWQAMDGRSLTDRGSDAPARLERRRREHFPAGGSLRLGSSDRQARFHSWGNRRHLR